MPLNAVKMMRTKWFPQPHEDVISIGWELDDAAIDTTIIPILMQDEGLGAPADIETNPENAAFAKSNQPNCFPDSLIERVYCNLQMSLTSKALDENLPAVKFAVMKINVAFDEDLKAIDPLSTNEVQDVLELTSEDTDNQAYPLWNGTKMASPSGTTHYLPTAVPGLTTNQGIEGVTFNQVTYYDALQYMKIAGKLKSVQHGLKWYTLTKRHPFVNIPIHLDSSVKRMNKKSLFAIMIHVPIADDQHQIVNTQDITAATQYVKGVFRNRFNEWHEKFYNGRT